MNVAERRDGEHGDEDRDGERRHWDAAILYRSLRNGNPAELTRATARRSLASEIPMHRSAVLGAIVTFGAISIAVSAYQAPKQTPAASALNATSIEKVKENLYVITGSGVANRDAFSGGNTAVFVTETGVVLVDTKLPGWGQPILDRIKTVTGKPVTTIINTHTHNDHTGSNEFFGAEVTIFAHENTRANMVKMDAFKGEKSKFLPTRTYKDKLSIGSGRDQVDLYYFGVGHTNGDTFIVFPAIRTLHTGDMFAWKALPYIDTSNGGSVTAHARTLANVFATLQKNVDTVITGHTPVLALSDLKEYAEFNRDFVAWATSQMKAGKSVDQAAAEYRVPERYKGYTVAAGPGLDMAKANLGIVFDELKR
jgi:glyoxylase-like metal-dependent hydrolase (beta-lactamase superfamily II)